MFPPVDKFLFGLVLFLEVTFFVVLILACGDPFAFVGRRRAVFNLLTRSTGRICTEYIVFVPKLCLVEVRVLQKIMKIIIVASQY